MSAPIGRRQFVASAGGTLFCTLAGHKLTSDSHVNIEQLAGGVPVPPRVAAYYAAQAQAETQAQIEPEFVSQTTPKAARRRRGPHVLDQGGQDEVEHRPDPPRRDDGHGRCRARRRSPRWPTSRGRRASPSRWARRRSRGRCCEAQTGDTIVVNFRNQTGVPVTMHPHGIFYTHDMDGAYKGKYTEPGGFVENGRTFQYVWEARPGTEGAWLYHDHGPMDPLPVFKGMFGAPDHPQAHRSGAQRGVLPLPALVHAAGHEPGAAVRVHQRARLRGQHAHAARQGGRHRQLARVRHRQRLPRLPSARPPLDRRGRRGHRQPHAGTGRRHRRFPSWRTTPVAGSTTATCSPTCTWG